MSRHDEGGAGRMFPPAKGRHRGWFVAIVAAVSIAAGLLPAGLAMYYGTAQRNVRFIVSRDGLEVPYKVGRIAVAAQDIAGVQVEFEPKRMVRTAGAAVGDVRMGWFRLSGYGSVYRLTTGPGPVVFVDVAKKVGPETSARAGLRYVFSPEDPEAFAAALDGAGRGDGPAAPVEFASRLEKSITYWPWILLSIVITLPTGVVMPWFVVRGRRGMAYEVGPEGVVVHHLGRRLYPWADLRDVSVREEPLKSLFRSFGAALPGYYVGRFNAQGMRNIQMNATRKEPPYIVLRTESDTVVLTPEEPEAFMEAVERFRPEDED